MSEDLALTGDQAIDLATQDKVEFLEYFRYPLVIEGAPAWSKQMKSGKTYYRPLFYNGSLWQVHYYHDERIKEVLSKRTVYSTLAGLAVTLTAPWLMMSGGLDVASIIIALGSGGGVAGAVAAGFTHAWKKNSTLKDSAYFKENLPKVYEFQYNVLQDWLRSRYQINISEDQAKTISDDLKQDRTAERYAFTDLHNKQWVMIPEMANDGKVSFFVEPNSAAIEVLPAYAGKSQLTEVSTSLPITLAQGSDNVAEAPELPSEVKELYISVVEKATAIAPSSSVETYHIITRSTTEADGAVADYWELTKLGAESQAREALTETLTLINQQLAVLVDARTQSLLNRTSTRNQYLKEAHNHSGMKDVIVLPAH
jgi:hypothetical protein